METFSREIMAAEMIACRDAILLRLKARIERDCLGGFHALPPILNGYHCGTHNAICEVDGSRSQDLNAVINKLRRRLKSRQLTMEDDDSHQRGYIYGATQVLDIAEKYTESYRGKEKGGE
jgi:hypothetical protein